MKKKQNNIPHITSKMILTLIAILTIISLGILFIPNENAPKTTTPQQTITPTQNTPSSNNPTNNTPKNITCNAENSCEQGECVITTNGNQCLANPCSLCTENQICETTGNQVIQVSCTPKTKITKANNALSITHNNDGSIHFTTGYDVCEDPKHIWDCLTDNETICTLTGINAPTTTPKNITVLCSNFGSNKMEELSGVIQ
jgi:cytoskeletal protein RodZ